MFEKRDRCPIWVDTKLHTRIKVAADLKRMNMRKFLLALMELYEELKREQRAAKLTQSGTPAPVSSPSDT